MNNLDMMIEPNNNDNKKIRYKKASPRKIIRPSSPCDSYFLKYKNETTGTIIYNFIKDKFIFKPNKNYKGIEPFPITRLKNIEDITDDMWDEFIRIWISERTIQECRPEVNSILKELKLNHYNEWDICRKNLAMSIEDYFWITKDNSLDYKDFNIRYCALNGKEPKYKAPFPIEKYPNYLEKRKYINFY
ncbi:TPA: hypothetical protein KPJ62_003947 [Clostridioides difficile]|nr:hypothetical protein [Clostridioides difficile]